MEILYFVIGLIIFDLAALRWGIDSKDGVASVEWERRWRS